MTTLHEVGTMCDMAGSTGVIKRRRLLQPNKNGDEMESTTLQTQGLIIHINKKQVEESSLNRDQENIATKTIGTMTIIPTGTKLQTDGTPTIVHCTKSNRAHKLIATRLKDFGEKLAHEMNVDVDKLQCTTVHQLEEISSERKTTDAFPKVNTQTNHNCIRIAKPKSPQQNGTSGLVNRCRKKQKQS